jgi:hypothetical protein
MTQPAFVRFESYGVRIMVTSDRADTLAAAASFLPPLRTSTAKGRAHRRFHVTSTTAPDGQTLCSLHRAGRVLTSSISLQNVLAALEWEVSLFVAQRAHDRIFVHAGAVEWQGKAIVVPGRSFSGKSTLVAQLVRAGCAYLSDEYAILDSTGACHAFPRRLSLRVAGGVERRTAEELGGRTRCEPLPVGCVLVTRYQQHASWQPLRLSSGEAAMALLQNTVAARARSREVLSVLRAATVSADAFKGARGDAAELVCALLAPGP